MKRRRWTTGDLKTARERWRDGLKACDIGRLLGGRSKNSIISAAHRYGWGAHPYGNDPRHVA